MGSRVFENRAAGRAMSSRVADIVGDRDALVLGLPRGGVVVAYEIAERLGAELDVYLVRKLGTPQHPELAMGAVAQGGVKVLNQDVVRYHGISEEQIETTVRIESEEIDRRERLYRGSRPAEGIEGRVAVLVDDGLATGATMKAAIMAIRKQNPELLIAAVPVGAPKVCEDIEAITDELVVLEKPSMFFAVGAWYQEFEQTTDEEVVHLLERNRKNRSGGE